MNTTRNDLAHTSDATLSRPLVFFIIALALMMMSINTTIVATALDALTRGLDTSINWAGWTITAYSVGFVLMLPVSGKLSERYGHYAVFLGSVVAFTVASLLCGFAQNIGQLIALRAIQAIGGAGFTPAATGIIVDHFGDERDRYVSLFGSIFPVGAMIGPIFGGLFVEYWTWRGIFFVNVPIGLLVAVLTLRYVPRGQLARARREAMDIVGMLLLGTGLLGGMLTASYLGETDVHSWTLLLLLPLVASVAALWGFVHHIHRTRSPFIRPRLLLGPGFGAVNLVNLLFGGMTNGAIALVPLYATSRYGLGALDSGTLLIAQGVAAVTLSVAVTFALRRIGYRPPIYVGGTIIIAGLVLLAVPPMAGISPYVWLACTTFLIGAGTGAINPACRNAGLQLAPRRASSIAAIRSMFMATGGIVTISLATAILAPASDPGGTQAWIYIGLAVILMVTLPTIRRVPEHHGAW
ncbi:MAG: MFS transporter [Ottowia sp.]|nr:MFS transporter [Ottowia sp.]